MFTLSSRRESRTRRTTRLGLAATATVLGAVALATPVPAHAAITNQTLSGTAGATKITLLNGAVSSGLTASSTLTTPNTGRTSSNATAGVAAGGVATTGAVSSKVSTTAITGGKKVTSEAQVANVNLLGGLVHADAITTQSTVKVVNGIATPSGATQFVGLKVAGITLPINIPKNYTVAVGNIARVTLNYAKGTQLSNATAKQSSAGIKVTLLGDAGTTPAGSTVLVAPANASATTPGQAIGAPVGGIGYSTKVSTVVNGAATVSSGPTAAMSLPAGGTAGKDVSNSTAGVNLSGILTTGALSNTVNGSRTPSASRSTITSKAAGLKLLGGLVKADAVTAHAVASKTSTGSVKLAGQSDLVNLVVGGKAIPLNVAPNTTINVLGLVKVTINEQVRTTTGITVHALDVRVIGGGLGLPVGARVEVGVANAWVVKAG